MRAVVYAQFKAVFVSVSLFPGCAVGDVDRFEVVETSAIFSCPSDSGLGCTIKGIVGSSEFNGVSIVFSCPLFSVRRCPVVFLPLIYAVFCTSRLTVNGFWDISPNSKNSIFPNS